MNNFLGIGVVGNFAGHLSQAGEAKDFRDVGAETADAPKGIFPFFIPYEIDGDFKPCGRYCINNQYIILPEDQSLNVQAEPELGLECDLIYDSNHQITEIIPRFFMAFNDTSVRNDKSAKKLSQKKNFSSGSKAYGNKIPIDCFSDGGICDSYSLVSFIKFDNELRLYGQLCGLKDYSYFGQKLLNWLKDRLNNQKDVATLEDFSEILKQSNYPQKVLLAIGATCYSELGENRFLQEKDEIFIVVFDHKKYDITEIKQILTNHTRSFLPSNDLSIVRQKVIRP